MTLLGHGRIAGGMLAVVSLTASAEAGQACAAPTQCYPYPTQSQPYTAPCPPAAPVPGDPGTTLPPVVDQPMTQPPVTQAPTPSAQMFQAQAASEAGLNELAFSQAGAGYIDIAVPQTYFRLRYDAAFNGDFSMDRAEYMYPAYRTFAQAGAIGGGGIGGGGIGGGGIGGGGIGGGGTGGIAGNNATADVDLQEVHAYLEYAFGPRFSVFFDLPFRTVDTTLTDVTGIDAASGGGLGDVWFGFKYALIATPDDYLTFQTKFYTPTGDEGDGLGTGHSSIEPGLLFQSAVTPDVILFGEGKYWIPIDPTDVPADVTGASGRYSSGVFQYGLGAAIDLVERQTWKVQSVNELVGWTAIDSLQGDPNTATLARDASGDTIVNIKLGARFFHMCRGRERSSIYAGWGHALTGDKWYEDLFRLEYRVLF